MHLPSVIHHLVLPWKRTMTFTLTAIALEDWAPVDGLLCRMSSIVVPLELVPTFVRSPVTLRISALEGEAPQVGCDLDDTDVGNGRSGRSRRLCQSMRKHIQRQLRFITSEGLVPTGVL
jgi:hypothetical protein